MTSIADSAVVDLSTFETHVLASGLKKLLRELPDPLVPSQWYDAFIEASRKSKLLIANDFDRIDKNVCLNLVVIGP